MSRLAAASALAALLAACCPTPPRATTPPVPTGDPPVTGGGSAAPTEPAAPTPVALDWSKAGIDWSRPPASWPERPFTPPTPERFVLANGVTVLLIENHRLPLVSVQVLHGAAGNRGDGAKAGLAALTADLLDEGAGARDALELPEELERLGARLAVSAASDGALLSLDTLAETLEPSLALAADVILRPRFAAADFERVKAERVADLALRVDNPRAIASLVTERVVFGDHPYGQPGTGWPDTVGALTLADVKRFWKASYGPAATTIIVAGDVTRAQLEPVLTRLFGGWKNKVAAPRAPRPPAPRPPVLAVVDMPGRPQTVVSIARLGPDVGDPARAAHDLVNTALGGSFASRLNSRLREQLGYTYGVRSQFWRAQWGGLWSVVSSVRTDATGPAIKEALAIIADTARAPLPAAELAKTKALVVRGLPQEFETNASIAGAFATLVAEQRPLDFWAGRAGALEAVTAEAGQQAVAAAWATPSIVVVGDWKAIGKDLEALGLPIVRYDVQARPRP